MSKIQEMTPTLATIINLSVMMMITRKIPIPSLHSTAAKRAKSQKRSKRSSKLKKNPSATTSLSLTL
jgi:hypothetical protein